MATHKALLIEKQGRPVIDQLAEDYKRAPAKKERKPRGKLRNGGRAGAGRRPGVGNRTTECMKTAILLAAEEAGQVLDPKAENGIVAYLKTIALEDRPVFGQLLGKVIPHTINHNKQVDSEITVRIDVIDPKAPVIDA